MRRSLIPFAAVGLGVLATFLAEPVRTHETANTTVTFDREISRILRKKCIVCHTERNLAFPMTTYEQTRPWARSIEEEVLHRHMPPWRAVPGYGQFVNDAGLTGRELQTLVAWIEGNGPKTRSQRVILIDQGTTPPSERLEVDFDQWQMGQPDLLRTVGPSEIGANEAASVERIVIDLGLDSERWMRGMEFKPGDRRVARAAFFFLEGTGQWLGSWTPWYGITDLGEGSAYRLPRGARVVAEVHYRGAEEPVKDSGQLGLYFADARPSQCPSDLVLTGKASAEPAGTSKAARVRASHTLLEDIKLLSLKPDLSSGVRSIEVTAHKPDGNVEVVLFVKDVLPEWPTPYVLTQPRPLPKGTKLSVTGYYDPAEGNTGQQLGLRASLYSSGSCS